MKKCILAIFVFACIGISVSMSQNKRGTFILGFGYSYCSDIAIAPYNKTMLDNVGYLASSVPQRDISYSVASYYFQMNTLLKEINANTSISLNISPGIRLSGSYYGVLSGNMPITLNFNKGMLSSFNSDKNTGVTFGIGANILTSTLYSPDQDNFFFIYAQPCAQIGFRFWNRARPYEVMMQAGYLPLKDGIFQTASYNSAYPYTTIVNNPVSNYSASFRISMVRYLNY
jgi:hypothetical protein